VTLSWLGALAAGLVPGLRGLAPEVAGLGTRGSGFSAPEISNNRANRSNIRGEFSVDGEFSGIISDKSPSRENSPL
jgi:hypothetical protein